MKLKDCLSFDDVLLEPQYSDIETRADVSLSAILSNDLFLQLPIISSPMDTVTDTVMARAMSANGGLGIIHRYNTIEQQTNSVRQLDNWEDGSIFIKRAAAIGVSGDFFERAKELVNVGCCRLLCIDVAHGHHVSMQKALDILKKEFGARVHIMAGNVATYDGALALAQWGADSIRVGIGGGSICSTRIMTGHGIPTFQSILDCAEVKEQYDVKIIADGGIRTPGDCAKAIAAGADFVMLGNMLAGTDETPGEIMEYLDREAGIIRKYKTYRGMASTEAQIDWRGKVSSQEGISTRIAYKGSVESILLNIRTNLASAFSYSGARTYAEFQRKAKFIRQTNSGQIESSTHILNSGGKLT